MIISGYKFDSVEEATNAIIALNTHFGIPVSDDATTRTVTTAIEDGTFLYIRADDSFVSVLGEPIEIEVSEPTSEIPS
jgi:hypothetical protein